MRLPGGFLGTDADLLIDVIIVALPIVVGLMIWAIRKARAGDFRGHRNVQIALASTLAVVVTALEIDLHYMSDGIMEMAAASRYSAETLQWVLNLHLVFSTTTAILWIGLILLSLKRFGPEPTPGAFSRAHRFWGRVAAIDMALTALTGGLFYVLCFVTTG